MVRLVRNVHLFHILWIVFSLTGLATVILAGDVRIHTILFVTGYTLMGVGYLSLIASFVNRKEEPRVLPYAVAAFCAAGIFIFLPTTISTDIYRYLWDGGLLAHGINPYLITPIQAYPRVFDNSIFQLLDYKDQYTVYPPLAQILFAIAYGLYISLGITAAKLFFAIPLCLLAWLLYHRLAKNAWILFILNPFLLAEGFNAGHIDMWMILFVTLSILAYEKGSRTLSAASLAAAILTKIHPAALLPFFIIDTYRRAGTRAALWYAAACMGLVGIAYLPLYTHLPFLMRRYGEWVQTMQFNASLYALTRFVFTSLQIHIQLISLILLVMLTIGIACILRRTWSLYNLALAMVLFFSVSSVVFPWYLVAFVPFVFLTFRDNSSCTNLVLLTITQILVSLTYLSEISYTPSPQIAVYVCAFSFAEYAIIFGLLFYSYSRTAGGEMSEEFN